jgi:hypothetical protein
MNPKLETVPTHFNELLKNTMTKPCSSLREEFPDSSLPPLDNRAYFRTPIPSALVHFKTLNLHRSSYTGGVTRPKDL